MLWTVYEALDSIGSEMVVLEDALVDGRGDHSLRRRTVGGAHARLSVLRRLLAPHSGIFERISAEVENAVIVAIICDRGDRYLSTGVFDPTPN